MSKPPDDLKSWSKNNLVREVQRLRAVLHEHSERRGDDPRQRATGGPPIIDVAEDPNSLDGAIVDARAATLLEEVDVCLIDSKSGDVGLVAMVVIGGRVNYSNDRVTHSYLTTPDGAAGLVTELVELARRASAHERTKPYAVEFEDDMRQRFTRLNREG